MTPGPKDPSVVSSMGRSLQHGQYVSPGARNPKHCGRGRSWP